MEWIKPTILLDVQDKPDVIHINGKVNEDDVSIYGTAHVASEPPEDKQ